MSQHQRQLLWAVPLLLVAFLYNIGGYPLMDNNEGLYASIAQWILHSNEWILPKLNGVLYLEKPPLLYWLMALSFKAFGVNEWAARLVPALSGAITSLFLIYFVRRAVDNQFAKASKKDSEKASEMARQGTAEPSSSVKSLGDIPFMSALLFGSSIGVVIIGRTVYFDMLFCCLFTIAMGSFYLWNHVQQKRHLYVGFCALALATLTKGLMAPALGGVILLLYMMFTRPSFSVFKGYIWSKGVLFFFLIAAPWHILASITHEPFAWAYFVNEHWNRFLGVREPKDYYSGPFYYYVPRILLYITPWVGTIVFLFKTFFGKETRAHSQLQSLRLFSTIWFVVVFLFFSLSQAKANYYMVLGMPALMILLSIGLYNSTKPRGLLFHKIAFLAVVSLFASGFLGIAYIPDAFSESSGYSLIVKVLAAIDPLHLKGIGFGFVILAIFALVSETHMQLVKRGALVGVLAVTAATHIAPVISDSYSSKNAVHSIPFIALGSGDVYLYKDFEYLSSVAFYIKRPVAVIESASADLLYGQTNMRQKQGAVMQKSYMDSRQRQYQGFAYYDELFPKLDSVLESAKEERRDIYIISRPYYRPILEQAGLCLKGDFGLRHVYSTDCESSTGL